VGGGLGTLGFMSDQRDGGVLGGEVLEFDLAEARGRGGVDAGEGGLGSYGILDGQISDEDPHKRARIHCKVLEFLRLVSSSHR
jgi:hypothetical protein